MQTILDFFRPILPHLADYAVYAAIVVVSVIGVIRCLVPLWTTRRALRRAIRRLQEEAGTLTDHPVWQENMFLGKRLRGCWLRFLQNAIQLDRRGLPCNVEDYVNDDTVTHGPGNAPLAELIPSLLTSLGILGTFMGMVQGLTGLDVTTTENMMTGIQNLLNGMQYAFGTSVAGVSCSIIFNMLNRIAQGSSYRAIDDFTESFTQLAMQRPLDNDVQLICQNQDRNRLLTHVSDTMTTAVPQAVESAVRSGMQPMTQAMSDFLRGATSAQIDGVNTIVQSFVEQMNRSLSGQFLSLGKTMADINIHQKASMESLNASLDSSRAMAGEIQRLQQVSQGILAQFEGYIAELGDARRRDEGFEKNTSALLDSLHRASQEQSALLDHVRGAQAELEQSMRQFSSSSRDTLRQITEEGRTGAEALHRSGKEIGDASTRLSQSYDTFVQNVVEGLSRSLGMFESSMAGVIDSLKAQMGAAGATELTGIQRTLSGMEQLLREALENRED